VTNRPDKCFAARVRAINDPIRLLGVVARVLGPLHPDGNTREVIRRVERIHLTAMRDRRRAYYAKRKVKAQ
jgi:hypothetical protein